jgi:pre-mRNA-splicing helicase BRR2
MQTQVFQSFFLAGENIFLGAPVGSGKTACFLLSILRLWVQEKKNVSSSAN